MVIARTPRKKRRGVFVWGSCSLFLLFAATFASAFAADPGANCLLDTVSPRQQPQTVIIRSVIDGDTVILDNGARVRLIGINTPEINRHNPHADPVAISAQRAVRTFFGDNNQALFVEGVKAKDVYGRSLAHLFSVDGKSLEASLLEKGLGWHVAVPPNLAMAECLSSVEQGAREQKLGVWQRAPTASTRIKGGGFHRIQGRVENVNFAKAWWINLEGGLSAVIYPENQHRFSQRWLKNLKSRRVELQGWGYPVHTRHGNWRIKLETPYGITLTD